MAKSTGNLLAGRYRLVERLGKGGMGEVWRADHLSLRSAVAVKLLHPELVSTEDGALRFEREAQAAAALRSTHVVHTMDHGVDGGVPFMVMELLDGESLADRLRRERVLTPRQTMRVMTHVGRALSKANELGLVHRDVKPENIFVVRNDDEEICKLVDFGVVKVRSSELENVSQTKSGALVGTPLYMSPEQLRAKATDHRSDLWSLAIVAYECLTGAMPYSADSLADLVVQITREAMPKPSQVASVPPGFDEWFERATQRDPALRFQSAREMVDALRRVLDTAPDVAARLSIPSISTSQNRASGDAPTLSASSSEYTAPKKSKRSAVPFVVAALVIGVVAGVAVWPRRSPVSVAAPIPPNPSASPIASVVVSVVPTDPPPIHSAPIASAVAIPTARPTHAPSHSSAPKTSANPLLF